MGAVIDAVALISPAGIVGAVIGVYIGWIDYRLACGHLRAWTEKRIQGAASPRVVWLHRNRSLVEKALLAITLLGFPALGYLAGASLAGG